MIVSHFSLVRRRITANECKVGRLRAISADYSVECAGYVQWIQIYECATQHQRAVYHTFLFLATLGFRVYAGVYITLARV